MIKLVLIAAVMVTGAGIKSCEVSTNTNSIKKVEFIFSYPLIQITEGKIFFSNLKDTICIFYYHNYILYRLPTRKSFETGENIAGTERYFLYKKNDVYGLFFKTKNDMIGTKAPVDSFLVNDGMQGMDFERPSDSLWKFIGQVKDKGIVLEKYAALKQGSEVSLDSIYYYYSKKLENVEYSFSKHLDSLANMKLFKVRLLINQKYSPRYNLTLPKREFLFEIKETPVSNTENLIQIFERSKKIDSLIKR